MGEMGKQEYADNADQSHIKLMLYFPDQVVLELSVRLIMPKLTSWLLLLLLNVNGSVSSELEIVRPFTFSLLVQSWCRNF